MPVIGKVVAVSKARVKVKEPAAAPLRDDYRAFAAAIGRLLRLSRAVLTEHIKRHMQDYLGFEIGRAHV